MRPEAVKGSVSKGAEGKYFRGQDVAVALQHDEEAQLVKSTLMHMYDCSALTTCRPMQV